MTEQIVPVQPEGESCPDAERCPHCGSCLTHPLGWIHDEALGFDHPTQRQCQRCGQYWDSTYIPTDVLFNPMSVELTVEPHRHPHEEQTMTREDAEDDDVEVQ